MTITFEALREANRARIPLFKDKHGNIVHKADGSDWSPAQWYQAASGEMGEYANLRKKFERGDLTEEEFQREAAKGDFFWPGYLEEMRPNDSAVGQPARSLTSAHEKRVRRTKSVRRGSR